MAGGARQDDEGARRPVTVFVSDPSAEADGVAQALRASGYSVVDVPLAMLAARVAAQRPPVVLVDVDSDGALEVVARTRELPEGGEGHVLFVARPEGIVATAEEALVHGAAGLFVRPIDVPALIRRVGELTGGPRPQTLSLDGIAGGSAYGAPLTSGANPATAKGSTMPPSLPPPSIRGAVPSASASAAAVPEVRLDLGESPWPGALRSSKAPSEPPPPFGAPRAPGGMGPAGGVAPPISAEVQDLLEDAETRLKAQWQGEWPLGGHESALPSPEEEIEAVLPAELLAALDEPLDEDEDEDDVVVPARTSTGSMQAARERTNDGGASRTTGATTGNEATPRGSAAPRHLTSEHPLTPAPGHTHAGPTGTGISTGGGSDANGRVDLAGSLPARASASMAPPSVPSIPDAGYPVVLGDGDAIHVLARAIATRATWSFCFVSEIERRVVLREGDVVTCASNAEEESLLGFLSVRGDLPRETVRRLGVKFPPFGRHAGAALVARGYLHQDQMWPTLRAHAEWLLSRVLQMPGGRLAVEPAPPGRLAGEPSVFGGATGAEVLVEVLRRVVPAADATERLGGLGSRIGEGPAVALLAECALGPTETEIVHTALGRSLREVLARAPDGDLATVLYALAQLGVVDVMRSVGGSAEIDAGSSPDVAALDSEAIRERVRARLQLVEDGDYFAVLGIARDATGYEVRRAFLELRRAFDPSRVATPEIADLAGDLQTITVVLEEAYEILKDAARRERYRRAIEAIPER